MSSCNSLKEHIPKPGAKFSLCCREAISPECPNGIILLPEDWEERDIDPAIFCSHCKKRYEKWIGKPIPQLHEDFPFLNDYRMKVADLPFKENA